MSAFTALNGASPKAETENHGPIDRQNLNNGTINVAVPGTSSDDRPTSAGLSPSGVDGSNIGRESWPTQGPDRPINGVAIDKDYVHKRKRSESIDGPHRDSRDSQTQERTPDNSITVQTDSREGFTTPHRDYRGFGDDRRDQDSWYSRQGRDDNRSTYESHHATTPAHAHADDQMSDSARRSGGHAESDYGNGSPEGDDRSMHMYSGTYSSEHRGDILQHDPKKRKRNFSNRTKTGCLTCRKRKKKCDEQKPECEFPPPFQKPLSSVLLPFNPPLPYLHHQLSTPHPALVPPYLIALNLPLSFLSHRFYYNNTSFLLTSVYFDVVFKCTNMDSRQQLYSRWIRLCRLPPTARCRLAQTGQQGVGYTARVQGS